MNKKEIGEFIKQKRLDKALSQEALANKAKIRRQSILEIERSDVAYSIDRLQEVLTALDCDLTIEDVMREPEMYCFSNVKPSSSKFQF